jgi:hypothetical protein
VNLEISSHAIKRTVNCHCNFNCLNDKEKPKCCYDKPLCHVTTEIGSDMLHVDCNGDCNCSYKFNSVKARCICICPVRYEIYKSYIM